MTVNNSEEGKAVFNVPGLAEPCHTWYKVVGNIHSDVAPLITLHGGPGACHEYLLTLTDIERPLVFYDQIGNGRSTHLPEKNGDWNFWTPQLFKDELANLIRHLGLGGKPYDLYGQSWGGMLAAEWAIDSRSADLRRLVISNSLASAKIYAEGTDKIISRLPDDAQAAIAKAKKDGDWENDTVKAALMTMYETCLSLTRPFPPPELAPAFAWLEKDPTVYGTMYGPNEIENTGSLHDWSVVSEVHRIKVSTLLMNGMQEAEQTKAMQPFWDNIEKVKWVKQDQAGHFSHIDQRKDYMVYLKEFLDA